MRGLQSLLQTAAILILAILPAAAAENPNTARGFAPERVYQFGDLDSVNLFNGNLLVHFAIGQRYPVSSQLSYGLTLSYNSKVWDTVTHVVPANECGGSDEGLTSLPHFTSNAGAGWSLGMGRLFPVSDATGTGYFLFESPDGGGHVFGRALQFHQRGNLNSNAIYLTTDNSHLRLTITGWQLEQSPLDDAPVAATVELPDGTRQYYKVGATQGFEDWSLDKILDRFNNTIAVSWDTPGLTETISDPFGRQTVIQYQTAHENTRPYRKVVASVTVPAFTDPATGQNTATYRFSYNWVRLSVPAQLNICDPPYIDDVPLLAVLTLPDGTTFQMDHPQHTYSPYGTVSEPMMRTLTLPTGGYISYGYNGYLLPTETCKVNQPSQDGVVTRSYVDPFGKTQTWTYTQALGSTSYDTSQCQYDSSTPREGLQEPYDLSTTTVTTPSGAKEVHYFSVFQGGAPGTAGQEISPHNFRWEEYGRAITHGVAGIGSKLLSEEVYDCSSGVCPATPARSTYLEFESHGGDAPNFWDVLPKSSRTVFSDDPVGSDSRYVETTSDDYDGYGHYRKTTTGGNFAFGNVRSTYTNFNPGTGPDGRIGGVDPFAGNTAWILGTYSDDSVTENSHTAKTESYFEPGTGFLLRRRTLLGDGTTAANVARDAHDLLTVFSRNGTGIVTGEKNFGGDRCGVATLDDCGATITCPTLATIESSGVLPAGAIPEYEIAYDASYGTPSLTRFKKCNGTSMPFDSFHAVVDPTGVVSQTVATDGLSTSYVYDALGRLRSVTSPGESPLQVVYTPATRSGTALVPATATVTRGTTESRFQYNGLGRVWKEMRRMADGQWSLRATTYDEGGRIETQSGFEQASTGFAFQPVNRTSYTYDGFDRPRTVTAPDSHVTSFGYRGISERTTTVTIATGASETPAKNRETFDRQGRLISVVEAADTAAAVTTNYAYDVGGRLISVLMGTEGQSRGYLYDNRGFLLLESQPELGASGNGGITHMEYDARGHGHRQAVAYGADVRTDLDPAERVLRVFDIQWQRDLKLYQYDSGSQCVGTTCAGKLSLAARYNYDPDLGTVAVTESYQYSPVHGRPVRRDRTVGTTAAFTGASFYHTQSYDLLGNVQSITYPCRGIASPCEDTAHAPRTVSYGYTNGLLTNVGTWGTIAYQPNGLVASIRHNSPQYAATEVWAPDPWQIARPARITVTDPSNNTLWTSGNYDYDGAGNVKTIGATSYSYDAFSRLTQWTGGNGGATQTTTSITYDTFGNQLATQVAFCGTNAGGSRRCGGTTTQARTVVGTTNHYAGQTYDAAGNVLSDGTRNFTYDPLNVTMRTQAGGRDFRFFYSADDERIAAVEMLPGGGRRTTFTIRGFGNELLSEWLDGQWKEDEIWRGTQLLATESPTGRTNQHLDHLGSPRVKTNAFGAYLGSQDFSPFGSGGTSNGGALQFTGHERDAANLGGGTVDLPDYMHARYYSAGMGRFLSVDPSDSDVSRPQSWNRYSYVLNRPVNGTDPDGRCAVDGEQHGWLWCVGHAFGLVETQHERATNARVFFFMNAVTMGGREVDTSKMSDAQVNATFREFNRRWRAIAMSSQDPTHALDPAQVVVQHIPDSARHVLDAIDLFGSPLAGYKGGRAFANDGRGNGQVLPTTDANGDLVSYREWDVNPRQPGVDRGGERLVTGSDGSAWYTSDHYQTFIRIR